MTETNMQLIIRFFEFYEPSSNFSLLKSKDNGNYSIQFNRGFLKFESKISKSKQMRVLKGLLLIDSYNLKYIQNFPFNHYDHLKAKTSFNFMHCLFKAFNEMSGNSSPAISKLSLFIPSGVNFNYLINQPAYYSAYLDLHWGLVKINILPDIPEVIVETFLQSGICPFYIITGTNETDVLKEIYGILMENMKSENNYNQLNLYTEEELKILAQLKEIESI